MASEKIACGTLVELQGNDVSICILVCASRSYKTCQMLCYAPLLQTQSTSEYRQVRPLLQNQFTYRCRPNARHRHFIPALTHKVHGETFHQDTHANLAYIHITSHQHKVHLANAK